MRLRRWAPWLVLAATTATAAGGPIVGCARGDAGSPDLGAASDAGAEGTATFAEASDEIPPSFAECADETKQIYVVATDKTLYRFYPDTLKFVRVGVLACPTTAGTFSMAIDRQGRAWVEYTDGRIFAVNTNNATCKPTAFQPGQNGFVTFGMGYARNGPASYRDAAADDASSDGGDLDADLDASALDASAPAPDAAVTAPDASVEETLYVAGAGLASLDTKTFELNFLGSLTFGRTELTSLDTQLYAFSVGSGVIVGLDKATGATQVVYRSSAVDPAAAFAFAQWGGEFWIFTGTTSSIVTRYSPATDLSKVVVENTGMLIVGAGSSTCAPTTPVR